MFLIFIILHQKKIGLITKKDMRSNANRSLHKGGYYKIMGWWLRFRESFKKLFRLEIGFEIHHSTSNKLYLKVWEKWQLNACHASVKAANIIKYYFVLVTSLKETSQRPMDIIIMLIKCGILCPYERNTFNHQQSIPRRALDFLTMQI